MLTQKQLKEEVWYCKYTGKFWSKKNRPNGGACIGEELGSNYGEGYLIFSVKGKDYRSHRLAWLYIKGYFPENDIDHENGVRDDNTFSNLREVTQRCNSQNSCIYANNSSGFKGVSKSGSSWRAQVMVNNNIIYIGSYDTSIQAALARQDWERKSPDWNCDRRGCNDILIEEALIKERKAQERCLSGSLPWE